MPWYGAYNPGAIEYETNITHGGGGCPGGFRDWIIDGDRCITTAVTPPISAGVKTFGASFPEGYWPARVKVRFVGAAGNPQTVACQLRHNGSAVGVAKSTSVGVGPYDIEFDHLLNKEDEGWQAILSRAQLMDATFGITIDWTAITFVDTFDGMSVQVLADPAWAKVDVYAEPAWQFVNERTESTWNVDAEFAEPAWQSTNEQAVKP